MNLENSEWWRHKKEELLENIHQTKKLGTINIEILEIMEEILKTARVHRSITDFYKETVIENGE